MSAILPLVVPADLRLAAKPALNVKAMPRILARLTRLSFRYPWRCTAAVACALGATVFNLITPRLLGHAVDQAFSLLKAGDPDVLSWSGPFLTTALFIVGASAMRGMLTGTQGYLGENIAQRVGYDLRLAFFDKLQRLSFSYHDVVHSGELITRGMLDLEGVRAFLESGLLRVVTLLLLLSVGSWQLLLSDRVTGLLALSFVPFVVWRAARMGALLRLSWMGLQELMSQLNRTMEGKPARCPCRPRLFGDGLRDGEVRSMGERGVAAVQSADHAAHAVDESDELRLLRRHGFGLVGRRPTGCRAGR